jgi:mRNA-degrading endonuclease RelE of RelBE toxin-antitoxin system
MRQVRYSTSFVHQLNTLLAQGEAKFGSRLVDEKRDLILGTIDDHLARCPTKHRDVDLDPYSHAITGTPFVVFYEFDDNERRVFFIAHGRADRSRIDKKTVVW